jgi:hypothetical protein
LRHRVFGGRVVQEKGRTRAVQPAGGRILEPVVRIEWHCR